MIKKKNGECLTMYIKNRRDSVKSKDFGSYQTLCLTENLLLRIAYFSYTKRCKQAENENYDTFNLVYNKRNDCSLLSISDCWIYR